MLEIVALNEIRSFILNRIDHARYRIENVYYDAEINNKEMTSNGVVRVQFPIITQSTTTVKIVELQLVSTNGDVWAKQEINIDIETIQTGILYWFEFNVEEVKV